MKLHKCRGVRTTNMILYMPQTCLVEKVNAGSSHFYMFITFYIAIAILRALFINLKYWVNCDKKSAETFKK